MTTPVLPEVSAFLARKPALFIEGQWTPAQSEASIPVYNPATGAVIAYAADASAADVDRAVQSAHAAFVDGRWRKLRPVDRERTLLKLADLLEKYGDELAQLETLEQGKSLMISRMVEVGGGAEFMRYAAGLATKITGKTLDLSIAFPPGTQYTAYTRREPIGVVASIVPWNFPLMMAVHKIAPALAAGCCIVLKPSEATPLTALRLAELAIEAGVPVGVFNVVTGQGTGCGNALVTHPLISKVSFTGSTATGRAIGRAAVDRMTRFTLELGGKNPAIVLRDANVEQVVGGLMFAAFLNGGQVCAAASRVYIERPLFDTLVGAFEGAIKGMKIGAGMDPLAQINPLVSSVHRDKVNAYVADAVKNGADMVRGAAAPDNGFYVSPTLILNPNDGLALKREEVFGPVLALTPVDDVEEALCLANDSELGLTASLWTNDLKVAMNTVPRMQAGTVYVNSHVPLDPNMPFGGFKQSGMGRDFGPDWLDAYTETKSVCIAS